MKREGASIDRKRAIDGFVRVGSRIERGIKRDKEYIVQQFHLEASSNKKAVESLILRQSRRRTPRKQLKGRLSLGGVTLGSRKS